MKDSPLAPAYVSTGKTGVPPGRLRAFLIVLGIVILSFGLPLAQLFKFALGNELFSYTILIPLVSGYLLWLKRTTLPLVYSPTVILAGIAFTLGAIAVIVYWSMGGAGWPPQNRLAVQILAFVLFVIGTCATFFGPATLRAASFPMGFLLFMVPFPLAMVDGIEVFFQHTSASAAAGFFQLAGTPFFREQTFFQLPGINLEVAPECSGIRSSLALLITSLVAGQLFLRTTWKRIVLAAVVIPLGILRNGLRIFTIGELCVHISPEMIDSYIHRQGGPIFFAISLLPFSLILFVLVRSERSRSPAQPTVFTGTSAPVPHA